MKRIVLFWLMLWPALGAAAMLEGVGHATIHDGNVEQARSEARQAAMRDLALQYEARISSSDTVENGELVQSSTRVSSTATVRDAEVVDEFRNGNLLRVIVRGDVVSGNGDECKAGAARELRKRVAVTGFPIVSPEQGGNQVLDNAGERLPQALVARLQREGNMQVLGNTSLQLFGNLADAPTSRGNIAANHLTNVVQLARELGAQFVVSGVIRDMGLSDPNAWGSSIIDKMQRGIGVVDTSRRFEVELMVFDGFSGSPVYRKRFETSAQWDPQGSDGISASGFESSKWGRAVSGVIDRMVGTVNESLACQPFMTRITRVDGDRVTLESGATAGLRPGVEMDVYRTRRYFDSLNGTPELTDAGVAITLNNVHPDFSTGQMPRHSGQVNIQRDDIAIIW